MIAPGRPGGRDRKKLRFAGILAAACMLVFQALATSFAAGAAVPAFQPALDSFGNPLCISGGVDNLPEDGNTGPGHAPFPDACACACCALFLPGPDDRAEASLSNPRMQTGNGPFAHADLPKRQPFPARESRSPRAPPAMM